MSDKFRYKESGYDERQTAVRGRAFKWAYITLLVSLGIYCVTDGIWNWCVPFTGCASAISISVIVMACICIDGDAYWLTNKNLVGQYVSFALIGILNLGIAIAAAIDGTLVSEGRVQLAGANLALSCAFVSLFIAALAHHAQLQQESDDD